MACSECEGPAAVVMERLGGSQEAVIGELRPPSCVNLYGTGHSAGAFRGFSSCDDFCSSGVLVLYDADYLERCCDRHGWAARGAACRGGRHRTHHLLLRPLPGKPPVHPPEVFRLRRWPQCLLRGWRCLTLQDQFPVPIPLQLLR
jgi:hypothetical protein